VTKCGVCPPKKEKEKEQKWVTNSVPSMEIRFEAAAEWAGEMGGRKRPQRGFLKMKTMTYQLCPMDGGLLRGCGLVDRNSAPGSLDLCFAMLCTHT